ncbi:MAG: hypothetical protein NUW37_03565 [Planctomycetes bacterium]|nr:hypothetical protein [Planctomycetota bacterium]
MNHSEIERIRRVEHALRELGFEIDLDNYSVTIFEREIPIEKIAKSGMTGVLWSFLPKSALPTVRRPA